MAEEEKKVKPQVAVEARLSAVQENPDGTVTVTLLTDRISVSVKSPFGRGGELWTNIGHAPVGDWPLRITMTVEEAKTLAGRMKIVREVIATIEDSHLTCALAISERKGNDDFPYKEAAREFDR